MAAVEAQLDGTIYAHLREDRHVFGSRRHKEVHPGDVLLIEANAEVISETNRLWGTEFALPAELERANTWVEVVVLPQSLIIGSTATRSKRSPPEGSRLPLLPRVCNELEGAWPIFRSAWEISSSSMANLTQSIRRWRRWIALLCHRSLRASRAPVGQPWLHSSR